MRSDADTEPKVLVIGGPIAPEHIPELCRRLRESLECSDRDLVLCDVSALEDPDAITVDALARLQLTARGLGCEVRLIHACGELRELLDLMGLADVVPVFVELPLEPGRQAEQRKEFRGVEKEADSGDLSP